MSHETLSVMLTLARGAAELIREIYDTEFKVDYKGPKDPVTEADRKANRLICDGLAAAFPDAAIVAEESKPESYVDFRKAKQVFFVDPLDGTKEFIKRNGEFVVMLGMIEDDLARASVILAPATGYAWIGEVGAGAWEIAPDDTRTQIFVSPQAALDQARVVASRSHRTEESERALAILGVDRIEALGSAGLKGAEVASGRAEAYVSPGTAGKRWDACAVDALVRAAGGMVTDAYGDNIDYRGENLTNDRGIVATNSALHAALIERLAIAKAARDGG
ncbi:MAG: 3'(2'),5'-bisphosphate nucleotidase CysQ [Polyangiaceae bacterium]|nr:3'(2'),5'-bisphosphate nucleotidase CysQ [Polyangiaceae bacterium]